MTFSAVELKVALGNFAASNQAGRFTSALASLLPASMLPTSISISALPVSGCFGSNLTCAVNLSNLPSIGTFICFDTKVIWLLARSTLCCAQQNGVAASRAAIKIPLTNCERIIQLSFPGLTNGSMRASTPSRCVKWCWSAAPIWINTKTSAQYASIRWLDLNTSASAASFPTGLGNGSMPRYTTGTPLAALNSQPESGMANISAYNTQCMQWMAACRHDGIVAGSGGPGWKARHAMRRVASQNTVTPSHLWYEYHLSFCGESGRSTIDMPNRKAPIMNSATRQGNDFATAP